MSGSKRQRPNAGFTLPLILAFVAAVSILMIGISQMVRTSTHQTTYIDIMEDVYAVAESGLAVGISQLVYDPLMCSNPNFSMPVTTSGALTVQYQNSCAQRNVPGHGGLYYITTSASATVNGKPHNQTLYSYVTISNVSNYAMASTTDLSIAPGANLGNGKIYARTALFFTTTGPAITVGSAEFFGSVTPPLGASPYSPMVNILAAPNEPVKLTAPRIFPEMTPADMARYQTLAGPHTTQTQFSGQIYPPGYHGFVGNEPGDTYPSHTTNNAEHVYYSDSDIWIGDPINPTEVHGQVLFVSNGDIYIRGDIVVCNGVHPIPGAGFPNGSAVHQVPVLIPGPNKSVYISDQICKNDAPSHTGGILDVSAFVMAVSGNLVAQYCNGDKDDTEHGFWVLNFMGAMAIGGSPNTLGERFVGGPPPRIYTYEDNLRTNPPPYVPAISNIEYQWSKTN